MFKARKSRRFGEKTKTETDLPLFHYIGKTLLKQRELMGCFH